MDCSLVPAAMLNRIKRSSVLALVPLVLLASGCGLGFLLGDYDDTCYDCRTVCEGAQGDALDGCLASCVECQGHSECFESMEWGFEGMTNDIDEWTPIDCDELTVPPPGD